MFLQKFNICLVMNFIPVIPAGKWDANNQANAMNYDDVINCYLSEWEY